MTTRDEHSGRERDRENRMTLLSIDPASTTVEQVRAAADEYHDLAATCAHDDRHTLDGSRCVVVGGGLVGLMTAVFLRRAGADVTVFEAKSFAAAASGRNAGGIYATGRAIDEVPLARASVDLWQRLTDEGHATHFRRDGHAIVAMTSYEAGILEAAHALYAAAGVTCELLLEDDVRRAIPGINPGAHAALVGTEDGQGYPLSTAPSLLAELRSRDAHIFDHTPVEEVIVEHGRARGVMTSTSSYNADHVVLCTGPWTARFSDIAGYELSVRPRRSQIMVTERVKAVDGMPFVSGNKVYARQTHEGNVLAGAGGPWETDGYDVSTTYQALGLISSHLQSLFPVLGPTPVMRAFAGTVELTPDHLPLLGPSGTVDRLWISAGYNGHGFGLSALAGRLLAAYIARNGAVSFPEGVRNALRRTDPRRFLEGAA